MIPEYSVLNSHDIFNVNLLFLQFTLIIWLIFIFNHPTGTDQEWKFVHGLYEFAIYGGRVDNTFDLRVMVSYLRQFFDGNTLSQGRNKRLGPLRLPTSTNFRVGFKMCY